MRLTSQHLNLAGEIVANFVLPWLVYHWSEVRWGTTGALIVSSVPPTVWSLVQWLQHRRVDAVSVIILAGIALSFAATALGGSPKVLLMRESLISGLVGLVFLLSTLRRRPMMYYLARATLVRQGPEHAQRFDAAAIRPDGRCAVWLVTMNGTWGAGLVVETLIRVTLIETLTPGQVLLISPWVTYGIYGLLGVWTWWYRKRIVRRYAAQIPDLPASGRVL
ncbi:VC0807 family protein [Pararobbsia silviterrae]|uniref:Transmembrane protein n=1 Tax=Pararobbsia silviterrae TaxID=1792498 RepID=A0A494XSC9_9BURK|nr:VC0807 family protein [Pararobbsia silviterrae]RKP53505.1 hypothetical protein D7S86_17000 [Pararobbsia silviterrae]